MTQFALLLNRIALGSIAWLCTCTYLIHLISSSKHLTALLFYCNVIVTTVMAYVLLWMYAPGNYEPLGTMLMFMFNEGARARFAVSLFYLSCTSATLAVFSSQLNSEMQEPNVRKFFHLVVSLVCVAGLIVDVQHLLVASVMIAGCFVLTEVGCTRALRVEPFGLHLHRLFVHFIDAQDSPQLILTPIYLICGIFLPLWLQPITIREQLNMRHFSGVISVGVGDTMAAFIGRRYGTWKWPNSKKSLQGTLAAVLSQTVAMIVISCYLDQVSNVLYLPWLIASAMIVSAAEVYCTSMDNIVLPVFMYALLSLPVFL